MIRRQPRSTRTDTLFPNTTLFRAWKLGRKAGSSSEAIVSGVQPSDRCIERIGRGTEKRKISFLRTAKIWPLTSFAASDARKTARGAILSADIALKRSTRSRSASVSAGIVAVIRSEEHTSELQSLMRISYAV